MAMCSRSGGAVLQRDIQDWSEYKFEGNGYSSRHQFRVVAVDDQARIITLVEVPANQRKVIEADAQFAEGRRAAPWWASTPDEEARTAAARKYLMDVAEGRIKIEPSPAPSEPLAYMQAGLSD